MKTKITTENALGAYNVINSAKYTKLDDADKIKVWKIVRALKPVATKFDEESKDAAEKMKPENFDDDLQNAQDYERVLKENGDMSKVAIGAAEYGQFIDRLKKYNELVGKAIEKSAKKEIVLEFEPISEDAFGKLMASNDWNFEQVMVLGTLIVG